MGILTGSTARRKRGNVNDALELTSGPWVGVWDSGDLGDKDHSYLQNASDVWFRSTAERGGVWPRPQFTQKNASQLGTGNRYGQCLYEHARPDGTIDRFAFFAGKVYAWDGATTFTDITPGGVTISATARIFCCTFAGLLIVSDGVNKPWTYNPASTTAANIEVDAGSSAWTAFGQPVVYGGKLFFILKAKGGTTFRNTIIWSEEASASTGYLNGFTNSWELSQTDPRPLYALAATNAALYYFRANSIGAITGTVNPAFQTTATHDAVSTTEGTTLPATVVVTTTHVWFESSEGRVYRFAIGAPAVEPVWQAMQAELERLYGAFVSHIPTVACGGYSPDLGVVCFAVFGDNTSTTSAGIVYAFDALSGNYQGYWSPGRVDSMAACIDSTGRRTLCFLGDSADNGSHGDLFRQNALGESGAFTSLLPTITPRVILNDSVREWLVDLVEAHVTTMVNGSHSMTLYLYAADGSRTGSVTFSAISGASTADGYGPARVAMGVAVRTRVASVSAQQTGGSQPVIFEKITLRVRSPLNSTRTR